MTKLFTKSAFKQALICPTSLYYYYEDKTYENQNNDDDFLQALADGGNQAGDLARLYYEVPDDAFIQDLDKGRALTQTENLFKRENVTIAEAAFKWDRCFIRTDILKKTGNRIDLIEVKAKSWEDGVPFVNNGKTDSHIREYLYDLAFQKYVLMNSLAEKYPYTEFEIHGHLMLADKSKVADGPVNQFFVIEKEGKGSRVVRRKGAEVLLEQTHVLTAFNADDACDLIISGDAAEQKDTKVPYLRGQSFKEFVKDNCDRYCDHILVDSPLTETCFSCPFHCTGDSAPGMKDGRRGCFKRMARFTDDMFDLPQMADLNGTGLTHHERTKLMAEGKFLLSDLDEASFNLSRDTVNRYIREGRVGLTPFHRRLVQMALAGNMSLRTYNDVIVDLNGKFKSDDIYLDVEGLRAEMNAWEPPLHMIDFETTAVALPLYKGLSPYSQVAFQYSHHVIDIDKETGKYTISHKSQYINDKKNFNPNIEFVQHLYADLSKDKGSIFRYSNHENSILRAIRSQMVADGYSGDDRDVLINFIDSITHPTGDENRADRNLRAGERDMIDLWDVVKKYYMHKDMKGSNSIKQVLPAVLKSSTYLQEKYGKGKIYGSEIHSENITPDQAKDWITRDADGVIENPYKHLDAIASFLGVTAGELGAYDEMADMESGGESIANGGAALAAYTKLQFSDESMTAALKEALLRYCELDTMSMVFIWEYFHNEVYGKGKQ